MTPIIWWHRRPILHQTEIQKKYYSWLQVGKDKERRTVYKFVKKSDYKGQAQHEAKYLLFKDTIQKMENSTCKRRRDTC